MFGLPRAAGVMLLLLLLLLPLLLLLLLLLLPAAFPRPPRVLWATSCT